MGACISWTHFFYTYLLNSFLQLNDGAIYMVNKNIFLQSYFPYQFGDFVALRNFLYKSVNRKLLQCIACNSQILFVIFTSKIN